ncbi:hypothetical protein AND_003229 [Anopheles darlingi]|uniref:Bromo domain-containing protein n=1 Tax=Anopheles darlingi TaxID=43151 RepID=W5JQH3_ANODA|nr:hypothetical protein AND_003229 [Anopheles darlingi]
MCFPYLCGYPCFLYHDQTPSQPKEIAFHNAIDTYPSYPKATNLRGYSSSPSVGSQGTVSESKTDQEEDRWYNLTSTCCNSPTEELSRPTSCCASSCHSNESASSIQTISPHPAHIQTLSDSFFIASRYDDDDDDDEDDEDEEDNAKGKNGVTEQNQTFSDVETENNINNGNTVAAASHEVTIHESGSGEKQTQSEPTVKQTHPVRRVFSAEVESLLRLNRNMAPTATKLPGRQTNNSLSSVTGPVILPFPDAASTPKGASGNNNNTKSNGGTAADSSKSGPDAAANGGGGGGRKGKKGKSSNQQVLTKPTSSSSSALISSSFSFTETDEVLQIGMHKVLESIKNHDDAWPFMDPVDEDIAPRYYSIIRRPMDLQKMEEKLDNGEYAMFGDFQHDFRLIVNNCRLYNGQANEYTEMVNNLQIAFERARKKYFVEMSSDEETMGHEYPEMSRSSTSAAKEKAASSYHQSSKTSAAADSKIASKGTAAADTDGASDGSSTVKEKTKKSASTIGGSVTGRGSGVTPETAGIKNPAASSNSSSNSGRNKDGKAKPVKRSSVSSNGVTEQKEVKRNPVTNSAKKQKSAKPPEPTTDNTDPDPDTDPPEKGKSVSRGGKNLKRKHKEKEKVSGGKAAKSRKIKSESSDERSDTDMAEDHEKSTVVKRGSKEEKEGDDEDDEDWDDEPDRKRFKKERSDRNTIKKVKRERTDQTTAEDHEDTKVVPVTHPAPVQPIVDIDRSSKEVEQEEDYPVYESKKKAAIKALQRQEKEKKKSIAKLKKDEKKGKAPALASPAPVPATVSSTSNASSAKGIKSKPEPLSPERSLSRSPSPPLTPTVRSPSASSYRDESPKATAKQQHTSSGESMKASKSKKKAKVKKESTNTGSEGTQKHDKKGSKEGKSAATIEATTALDKKSKKSVSPSKSKPRQKQGAGKSSKEKVVGVSVEHDSDEAEEDEDVKPIVPVSAVENSEEEELHDYQACRKPESNKRQQNMSVEEKDDGQLTDDSGGVVKARSKKSEKSKNKKAKAPKQKTIVGDDDDDEEHNRSGHQRDNTKKGSKGKLKGKDKKSHKKDKSSREKKKSKGAASAAAANVQHRAPASSGGEEDEEEEDTTYEDRSSRQQQQQHKATDTENSKSSSKGVKHQATSKEARARDSTPVQDHQRRSRSRSVSRSPSPAASYYSEEDDQCVGDARKGSLDRPITPDIKDKFDLIKERRNRAAAAAAAAAENKAKAKQTKAKVKENAATASGNNGGGKKAGKQKASNRGQPKQQQEQQQQQQQQQQRLDVPEEPATITKHPKKRHQQQHQQDQENEKPAVGEVGRPNKATGATTKGKKKRDKSTEFSVPPVPNAAQDRKRPFAESKKVDRSSEYEFVDEGGAQMINSGTANESTDSDKRNAGSAAKTGQKRSSTVGGGPSSSAQKQSKGGGGGSAKSPARSPATFKAQPGGATSKGSSVPVPGGANMEELELETEQTLKDINKWLENTPRFTEYSSASNSPSRYIMDDFDPVPVKIEAADFRKPIPLAQLPPAATTVSEPSEKRMSSTATASPLRGASPGLAAMAAPPTAFLPKAQSLGKATNAERSKEGGVQMSQSTSGGETSLKENTSSTSSNNSATIGKNAGGTTTTTTGPSSSQHTILGPPPIIPAHSQKKEPKEPKRKTLKEKLSQLGGRKRDLHRTIDRLQPGKTKGNLIGTIQNLNKPDELFALGAAGGSAGGSGSAIGAGGTGSASGGPLGKFKEVKNSLIVQTDESKPKLSLGTVLNTEGFGIVQQHNFADDLKDDDGDDDDERDEENGEKKRTDAITHKLKGDEEKDHLDKKDSSSINSSSVSKLSSGTTAGRTMVETSPRAKGSEEKNGTCSLDGGKSAKDHADQSGKKESVPNSKSASTSASSALEEGKDGAKGGSTDKPAATPNLSAWFKAFGAPKKPKKPDDTDEAAGKGSPASEKGGGKGGNDQTPPSSESSLGGGGTGAAGSGVSHSLESSNYPSLPAPPRQRKASTGSTVSERSSYSQDPDSPRIGIDERIGGYPAPYPSPIGASPIMTSPKLDESQKSPYHPMNGAIKVGFYQDTTQKSSPEKSCSPRDLPSPYPQYSQHLYTANAGGTANITGSGSLYGSYTSYGTTNTGASTTSGGGGMTGANSTTNAPTSGGSITGGGAASGASTGNGSTASGNTTVTDAFKGYGKDMKSPVDFYDQYKQPASQESDYNSSMSPSTNPNSPYHNPASSPYQQQPNSPSCYPQQPSQGSSPYGHQQQQPLASPASSGGALSPYSTSSVTPNPPTIPHSPAGQGSGQMGGGHSPYSSNSGSVQAHSPYHGGATNSQSAVNPSATGGGGVAGGGPPKSKPNTPLHQSPNSPFSQSNQSSPYSQQDPNSPYSQGQLSPFQPMSPKPPPPQPSAIANSSGATQSTIKLAPPIITPQQAAAAAGVILPPDSSSSSSAVHSQSNAAAQNLATVPSQQTPASSTQHGQHQSSASPWGHQNQYNPYHSGTGSESGTESNPLSMPPAPAHMPTTSSSSSSQQPQQAHHNIHQHPSPAHAHTQQQQSQQLHQQQQQQQQPPPATATSVATNASSSGAASCASRSVYGWSAAVATKPAR